MWLKREDRQVAVVVASGAVVLSVSGLGAPELTSSHKSGVPFFGDEPGRCWSTKHFALDSYVLFDESGREL